ncbi:MAG: hypothetical protein ACYS6W_16085 [Planctomycetota bacterium]|jgi:hypothetical protein
MTESELTTNMIRKLAKKCEKHKIMPVSCKKCNKDYYVARKTGGWIDLPPKERIHFICEDCKDE